MKLKLAKSERTAPNRCLKCGEITDAASGVVNQHARNTKKPTPGAIMLCLYCGHAMAFAADMSPRELTADEQRHLAHDVKFQMARVALDMAIKARTKH
jgi:hypothetical protein